MILTICFLLLNFLTLIAAHGRLRDPAARSTAWRIDKSYPAYYNDHVCSKPIDLAKLRRLL